MIDVLFVLDSDDVDLLAGSARVRKEDEHSSHEDFEDVLEDALLALLLLTLLLEELEEELEEELFSATGGLRDPAPPGQKVIV